MEESQDSTSAEAEPDQISYITSTSQNSTTIPPDNNASGIDMDQEHQEPIFLLSGFPLTPNQTSKTRISSYILELGGKEADEYNDNITMLIAPSLARYEKVLCAISNGKPICHPTYIIDSYKAGMFLPITDNYLWKPSDSDWPREKQLARIFRFWFDKIQENPSNKPFNNKNVILFEPDEEKYDAYRRVIWISGGTLVSPDNIEVADVIVCENEDLNKLPDSTSSQTRTTERVEL